MTSVLQLNILVADNLLAMDDNGFSDPYCVIKYGGKIKKTKILKKTLNPRWNETFTFNMNGRDTSILIEVWDWDTVGRDDFLGQTFVDVASMDDRYEIKQYTLKGPKVSDTTERGTISLRMRMVSRQKQAHLPAHQLSVVKSRVVESLESDSQELSLEGCGLGSCPALLAEKLASLTSLDLSFNQFVQWPELTPLVHLQRLSLTGNLLINISPNISSLQALRELRVTGNQLVSLPPEIGKLQYLEKLYAGNNQILKVCNELGRLFRLEELDLSGNPISEVPQHMGGLRGLESLDMSGCELVELPEEFTLMTRLIELNLGNNHLRSLPEGVGRMTRLGVLNLMFNELSDLPMSLGNCQGLAKLGSGITIANNPITNQDMWKKYQVGTDHLFDYLEKRLMVDGNGVLDLPPTYLPDDLADYQDVSRKSVRAPAPVFQEKPQLEKQKSTVDDELITKMVVLKNWGISTIRGELKPRLNRVSQYLFKINNVEDVMPLAKYAKSIKPELERARVMLAMAATLPIGPSPGADKLGTLKSIVQNVVDDNVQVLDSAYNALSGMSDIQRVLEVIAVLKAMKKELAELTNVV